MAAELAPSLVLPQKDSPLNAPLITRRRLVLLAGGLATGLLAPRIAAARFPERPIRIIVGFAAGGTIDTIARLLAQALSPLLGQQVIVENRPGASASLAASAVVRSEADGHTLLFGVFSHAVAPALAHLTYDTLADLTAVSQVASVPLFMFAAGNAPFRTVADVVAAAKARPQTITYASGGPGSSAHLAAELFARRAGVSLVHVPYRS
jgi:tripartite-type tricarboxylate transporter receptor subunit TctC